MPKYSVRLCRNATETTDIEVEADSFDEANERGLEQAGKYGQNVGGWTRCDGNDEEVYLPDPDSTELLGH